VNGSDNKYHHKLYNPMSTIVVIMNALFVCNQNENRSKTAENIFKDRFQTRSAGLYNEKSLSADDLIWADTVFVMEDEHRKEISERFPSLYLQKRILCLDIPDTFHFNQPELIDTLKKAVNQATKDQIGF